MLGLGPRVGLNLSSTLFSNLGKLGQSSSFKSKSKNLGPVSALVSAEALQIFFHEIRSVYCCRGSFVVKLFEAEKTGSKDFLFGVMFSN